MARQRGNKWQADVLIGGVRKRPSFDSKEEAEAFEQKVSQGYALDGIPTIGKFADDNFDILWGGKKSERYIRGNLKVLFEFLDRDTPVDKVDDLLIEDTVQRMKQAGKAGGTINRKLANLAKLLKRAKKKRLIIAVPEIERQKEGKARERFLSVDEEQKAIDLFTHLGKPQIAALFTFLLYTGCRISEALTLDRKRVRDGYATFHHSLVKNETTRVVPLVPKAQEAWGIISRMTNEPTPFGALIPYWTMRDYWNRLRAHLEVEDDSEFVIHSLRHTCASRLVTAGVDLPRVQKWMGHKSIQVTMRYAHLAPKDLDVAAKALAAA